MTGSDKDLKIGISVRADTSGAKEAEKAIKEVGAVADQTARKTTEAAAKSATAAAESSKQTEAAIEQVTVAQDRAAEASTKAQETTEEMAKRFAEANSRAGEWANTLEQLNNEQLLELEERLRTDIKAAEELGQSTEKLKEKLADVYNVRTGPLEGSLGRVAGRGRDVARVGGDMAKQLGEVSKAAQGAGNVLSGLERGGIGGLIQSGRGAINVFTTLAKGAIGMTLLPALAATAGAIYLLRRRSEESEAAIKKLFEERAKQSEELKLAYAEIAAAAEKSLTSQIQLVERLTSGFSALLSRMDEAQGRANTLSDARFTLERATIDREEQTALQGAKSDEERAKITARFSERRTQLDRTQQTGQLDAREQFARQRIVVAEEAVRGLQGRRDIAAAEARDARDAAESATAISRDVITEKGADSPAARNAIAAAKEAAEAAKVAEQNLARLNEELAKTGALIDQEVTTQRAELERISIERETAQTRNQTAGLQRQNADAPRLAQLREQAQRSMESGDFAAQDKAVAEIRALTRAEQSSGGAIVTALKENAAARDAKDKLIIRTIDKQTRQIENAR